MPHTNNKPEHRKRRSSGSDFEKPDDRLSQLESKYMRTERRLARLKQRIEATKKQLPLSVDTLHLHEPGVYISETNRLWCNVYPNGRTTWYECEPDKEARFVRVLDTPPSVEDIGRIRLGQAFADVKRPLFHDKLGRLISNESGKITVESWELDVDTADSDNEPVGTIVEPVDSDEEFLRQNTPPPTESS